MSVSFDPETIYKNAFYSQNTYIFHKYDIIKFCNILIDEISNISSLNTEYKYVHFDFNKRTLNSFYENYFGTFNIIGEDIYLSEPIKEKEIIKLNSIYDDLIIKALNSARETFKINSK